MSVDPRGMTLTQWADAVVLTLGGNYGFGKLGSEAEWQDWAAGIVRAQPFVQRNPPNPYGFNDWRDFAERIYPMLEGTM